METYTEWEGKPLYKVLKDGRSYNGGDFKYNLPEQQADGSWKPGHWHHVAKHFRVIICHRGFHLTTKPFSWHQWGATVWRAEGKGYDWDHHGDDKIAFRSARLLEPAPLPWFYQPSLDFLAVIGADVWEDRRKNPGPLQAHWVRDDEASKPNAFYYTMNDALREWERAQFSGLEAGWYEAISSQVWNTAPDNCCLSELFWGLQVLKADCFTPEMRLIIGEFWAARSAGYEPCDYDLDTGKLTVKHFYG